MVGFLIFRCCTSVIFPETLRKATKILSYLSVYQALLETGVSVIKGKTCRLGLLDKF
jgi:hypothetical protein